MNTNAENELDATKNPTFTQACRAACHKLLAQIQNVKDTVLAEYQDTRRAQSHLLTLALNEAEAVAWQTGYPQLFFPLLAEEKALAVASWNQRQSLIRNNDRELAFAA